MISEIFVVLFIYSAMLFIDWKITLSYDYIFTIKCTISYKNYFKKDKTQGVLREKSQKDFYEIINSTFGNFKLIKLQSNDKGILDRFNNVSFSLLVLE